MRPRRFIQMQSLPLTPNGKVDRTALPPAPMPGVSADSEPSGPPLTPLESAVAIAWLAELGESCKASGGADSLGPDADFYALGGGSVQAVRVTRSLRSVLHGGGGGKPRWAEGASDWRDPAGDASLFLAPERAGDAECHFGLCDGGPFAPCALLERPVLKDYAAFLADSGVRTTAAAEEEQLSAAPAANLSGDTAQMLETSVRTGRFAILRALLDSGAPANGALAPRQRGMSPLHWAASRNDAEAVQLLIASGARVLSTTDMGAAPAHVAAAAGAADALRILLDCGTPPRIRDDTRQSLVHYAARAGSASAVCLAAERGAEVDALDKQLRTALHWAALAGDTPVVDALLAARANPNPPLLPDRMHARATRLPQESPLDLALRQHAGDLRLLETLVRAGAEGLRPGARREAEALIEQRGV
eukprot:gnl/TRDRNA2_/TRDRNA2_170952_c0_seq3.p1 gnl/TRDRNA2_/TRDRNA2_170952_c0~~gnl/TRDRNA2_/TRDRNA2_170952_c0_seq3.p1  ORF type:complete len:419 (-),score=70.02 gnl/TRDRNA2_/TRDRNA2_170952_c0_seq3:45-1301(-)